MSSFFTSGFAKKRAVTRGRSSPPDEIENTATTRRAGRVTEDSLATLHDREGRPLCTMHEDRRDPSTGAKIHHTMPGATTGFGYLLTPSSVQIAQPPPTPGYPLYVATPGVYAAAPQSLAFVPPPAHVIMPVVPLSNLVEWKTIDMGGGKADRKGGGGQCVEKGSASTKIGSAVEGFEKPVHEKKSGTYYVWEKFYDEEGKAVWIHTITGKRTRDDPYW